MQVGQRCRSAAPLSCSSGGLRFGAVNVEELLSTTLASGAAHEVSAKPDTLRTVQFGHIQIASLRPSGSNRSVDSRMSAAWKRLVGNTDLNLLLLADDDRSTGSVLTLGPSSAKNAPIHSVRAEKLLTVLDATTGMTALDSVRHVSGEIVRLASGGVLSGGLLPRHTLRKRLKQDERLLSTWESAAADMHFNGDWRAPLVALGWNIERLEPIGYLLRFDDRPSAVVLPKRNADEFARISPEDGRPPEGVLVAECAKQGARYGIMAHKNRYRLFDCESTTAAADWLDLDAPRLEGDDRALIGLLAPNYLAGDGLEKLRDEARLFGAELRKRLDSTIRTEALPALAVGLEQWAHEQKLNLESEDCRSELQQAAMTLLFRLLFVLYAESSGFLPMHLLAYRRRSLSELVAETHEKLGEHSGASTAIWSQVGLLFGALRTGNDAWGVPAYNGELFAATQFDGAELLERITLSDPCFARVLIALGHDAEERVGVDYSSLEIAHLGHIYETLLSLQLTLATQPVRYDGRRDQYIADTDEPEVQAGSLLWQTNEGGRKSGGVYYTPSSLVHHLVKGAVEPAFESHLQLVKDIAKTDPEAAADHLLRFAVLDPACGSAHFLVAAAQWLAERTLVFLAETPLPPIKRRLDELRAHGPGDTSTSDHALLRRLLLKHCVYGTDISQMGAEIARVSLWLASFVPGLSLAYLGRNVVVGNALLGVVSHASVVEDGTLLARDMMTKLAEASEAAVRVAAIGDRTPDEVALSVEADEDAKNATEGMRRLFDLWVAEGFGLENARHQAELHGTAIIDGSTGEYVEKLVAEAAEIAAKHGLLHWPLEFPSVLTDGRDGFDAVIGNPPWEELKVERLAYFGLHRPGLQGLAQNLRDRELALMAADMPELEAAFFAEERRVNTERQALASGEYTATRGDPDLYKYFCQRYRNLLKPGGMLGVVLPGSAFINKGSESFRDWLFNSVTTQRVDLLVNTGRWAFDSTPQYDVALITGQNAQPPTTHEFKLLGVADSEASWCEQSLSTGISLNKQILGEHLMVPSVSSQTEADLLGKLRRSNAFPFGPNRSYRCFPVNDLHETNDKYLWSDGTGSDQLWKGESFGQYQPHGAHSRPIANSEELQKKLTMKRPGAGSSLAKSLPLKVRRKAVLAELERDRLAFHGIGRATDGRTMLACLIPRGVFLANSAPYLAFVDGTPRDQAVCLGIMNSLPFDWQARRYTKINLNFFLVESMYVPDLEEIDFNTIATNAARLSCQDNRFEEFAAATGIECGPLDEEQHNQLRAEIDARIARAWDFTEEDFETMFSDFTLNTVPTDYRKLVVDNWRSLTVAT